MDKRTIMITSQRIFSKVVSCLALLLVAFFCQPANAQKKPILTEEEQVQEVVSAEIETLVKSKDFLKKKNKKYADVKGYVVIDIAVVKNGQVSSFFKVDSDIKNIDFMEFLSDTVLSYKFQFKLPKQQRYKIRQTINIE